MQAMMENFRVETPTKSTVPVSPSGSTRSQSSCEKLEHPAQLELEPTPPVPAASAAALARAPDEPELPTVLVSGAGIAGLALALFLQKSGKFRVRVFERSPELQPALGAHFGLNGALECLDRAGLRHVWEPIKYDVRRMTFDRKEDDNFLVDVDMYEFVKGTEIDGKFGLFMRGEVQRAMADELQDDVIVCGKDVSSVDDQGDRVQVTFKDGTTAEGDFLIGADGINSAVRRLVFPEIQKVWTGYKVSIMVHDGPPPSMLENRVYELFSNHGTCMAWGSGKGPSFIVLVAQPCEAPPSREEVQKASTVEAFSKLFQEVGAYEKGLVEEQHLRSAARLLHFGVFSLPADLDTWSKGRVCLLGDAIHATSPFIGQGANQAVQSAFCLARLLNEKGADRYQEVFEELHSIRAPVTKGIIGTSAAVARIRIKQRDEGCLDGLYRFLFYAYPRYLPSRWAHSVAKRFKVHV